MNKLLFYSGSELNVKLNFLDQWNLILSWDPEMRYKISKIRKQEAVAKVNAIKTIIRNIL